MTPLEAARSEIEGEPTDCGMPSCIMARALIAIHEAHTKYKNEAHPLDVFGMQSRRHIKAIDAALDGK